MLYLGNELIIWLITSTMLSRICNAATCLHIQLHSLIGSSVTILWTTLTIWLFTSIVWVVCTKIINSFLVQSLEILVEISRTTGLIASTLYAILTRILTAFIITFAKWYLLIIHRFYFVVIGMTFDLACWQALHTLLLVLQIFWDIFLIFVRNCSCR